MLAGFTAWVLISIGSELAGGALAFALTWTASGNGPQVASVVLTLSVAPAVLFGLDGGAVADRYGAQHTMIARTCALLAISATLAVVTAAAGPSTSILAVTALLIGSVAAFYRPAVGVFPRLFVDDEQLGTALAAIAGALIARDADLRRERPRS